MEIDLDLIGCWDWAGKQQTLLRLSLGALNALLYRNCSTALSTPPATLQRLPREGSLCSGPKLNVVFHWCAQKWLRFEQKELCEKDSIKLLDAPLRCFIIREAALDCNG